MNRQEVIDPVCEKFGKNGSDPEEEKEKRYDRIELHPDLQSDLRDAFLGAYAVQSVALVLLGDSAETVESRESARPLSEYSREGLLFAVELLAGQISNSLAAYERSLTAGRVG